MNMKSLSLWNEDNLRFLIEARLNETLEREYKRTITIDKPADRKELCKDVSGFANSQGGFIVFGLDETDVLGAGSVPASLSPITDRTLKETLEQVLVDGIMPRVDFRIYSFRDSGKTGEYVICEIPKSYRGLHMVTYDKDNRYYLRRNFQTTPMNSFEVENAFRTFLNLENLIESRLSQFSRPSFPLVFGPDNWGAWISVIAVPTFTVRDLLDPICFLPLHEISELSIGMRSRERLLGVDSFRPSFSGLTATGKRDDGITIYDHTIFRDGGILTGSCIGSRSNKFVGALTVLELVHNSLAFILGVFERAGYSAHFHFRISISFNSEYDLGVPPFVTEAEWARSNSVPPMFSFHRAISFSARDWTTAAPPVLEPLWHHFWQSLGYARCYYYDGSTGNYDKKLVLEKINWLT